MESEDPQANIPARETGGKALKGVPKQRKTKPSYAFLSKEDAERRIRPTLRRVFVIAKRMRSRTVPGWLNRLNLWLLRLERGNRHDARTPLFARLSYAGIEKMILGIVESRATSKSVLYKLVPSFYTEQLVAVEKHQAEKIGPRGVYPPAHEWMNGKITEIWTDKPPHKELNRDALEAALRRIASLRPAGSIDVDESSIEEGFKTAGTDEQDVNSLNVDTNSCAFTYVRGWYHKVWDKTVTTAQKLVQVLLVEESRLLWRKALKARSWKDNILTFWATAHQRTNVANGHRATKDNTYRGVIMSKLRAVCAMPKLDTILGKPILNRLIASVKEIRNPDGTRIFVALTTPELIDKSLEVCLETAQKHGLAPLSTDYSGYDTTVPPWLAMRVAEAVSHWMTERCAKIFMALIYSAFYNTGCITPTAIFEPGPSSMKSGSWMTNIMDSLINLTVQYYGLYAKHWNSIINQFVQGDDAILVGDGVNPKSFSKCASELGFVANEDKQYWDKDSLSFCQKIYVRGYPGGIYPIARATAATVSLEDDVGIETDEAGQFPYVLAYRTICRLGTACFNPNFVELVRLYEKEDKIHLGAALPPGKLAKLAGSYAVKYQREAIDKPWKSPGTRNGGFERQPVNRVLRGELPPPPGKALFEWVYGLSYDELAL